MRSLLEMCGASTEFCVLELSLVSPPWPRSVAHLPPPPALLLLLFLLYLQTGKHFLISITSNGVNAIAPGPPKTSGRVPIRALLQTA